MAAYYNRRNATEKRENDIQYIARDDARYPEYLRHYSGMPKGLWLLGRLPDPARPSVAIVGARDSSPFGDQTARWFASELAAAGVQIISGMAWGIDGMAHEGALEAGGDTFAVLGCGVDVCYPSGHRRLYESLIARGGVLSELEPGSPPLAYHFPLRNRIISALSDLVLVVEARAKSGSLITADLALEQGKEVFAVPGRVTDDLSRGCLNLIRQGAGLASSPAAVLEALGISENQDIFYKKNKKVLLANDENIVYSWLRLQPVSLEELVGKTGFSVSKTLAVLMGLELKGCIREVQKNHYVRTDLKFTDGEESGDRGVACKGEDN